MATKRVVGAKTLDEVEARLSPGRRAAIGRRVTALAAEELSLGDLRKAHKITQVDLVAKLFTLVVAGRGRLGRRGRGQTNDKDRCQHRSAASHNHLPLSHWGRLSPARTTMSNTCR